MVLYQIILVIVDRFFKKLEMKVNIIQSSIKRDYFRVEQAICLLTIKQIILIINLRQMVDNQQNIMPDLRLRSINMLYLSKNNCILRDHQKFHKARYLITLNSQADLSNSLAKICELFTDTIYQVKNDCGVTGVKASLRFNLLFEFMVKLYYLQDSFLSNIYKETEATLMSQYEIIDDLSYNFRTNQQIKQDFRDFNVNCKRFVQDQLRKQSYNDGGFIRLKKIRKKLLQIYKNHILNINTDSEQSLKRRRFYIPLEMQANPSLFISKTLISLINLRFTKKKYRLLKFQSFLNNYQHFFQAKIYRINQQSSQTVKKFTIRRYSNLKMNSDLSPDQMLISIENLIRVRKKEDANDAENIQIVRMLGSELVRHKKSTGCYYPNLTPKYVMLNQLSLQTQLSYYPPILEGLGFLKRPCNIEQTIAFRGSPFPLDQFSAPNEIALGSQEAQNDVREEVFFNYLYGIDSLLEKDEQNRIKSRGKSLIIPQANNKTMSQIRQRQQQYSEMWRYIMISSYILNSKVFSKQFLTNSTTFKQFLKKQEDLIEKDQGKYIQTVLGSKFFEHLHKNQRQNLKNQKKFTMSFFDNFLRKDTQNLHENIHFQKINDFILFRNGIIGNIAQLLKKDQIQKYANIYKYFSLLILFYLRAYQYLTSIKQILSLAGKDIFMVKKIFENPEVSKIFSFDDKNTGTIKNLQKSWQSLSSANEKSKDKKHRLYSIDQSYKKMFLQTNQTRRKCLCCHQIMKKQYFSGFTQENNSSYQRIIAEINPNIVFCLKAVLQICQKEVSHSRKDKNTEQVDSYITFLSLILKIKYFLFYNPSNSIKLNSVRQNLNIDIKSEDKKRTVEILEYCLSILSQQQINMIGLEGTNIIW